MKKITLLILMLFMLVGIKAQTSIPGGANATPGLGLELWLSADKLDGENAFPANGANVPRWVDRGGKYVYQQYGTDPVPLMKYDGLNFHPTLDFPNAVFAGKYKLASDKNFLWDTSADKHAYYMFMVSSMNSRKLTDTQIVFTMGSGSPYAVIGWRGTKRPGTYTTPGAENWHTADVLKDRLSGIVTGIHPNKYEAGATSPMRRQVYYNGIGAYSTSVAPLTVVPSRKSVIGSNVLTNAESFSGDVQEIIILTAEQGLPIDPMDLKKVHSYLALKYGQTLVAPYGTYMGADSYVDSNGKVVWSFADNTETGYNFNTEIFGIGRDDASGLYQKQSKSVDSGALTFFVGDLATLNQDNTGTLTDMFYLVAGSNVSGAAKYLTATSTATTYKNKVLKEAFTASTLDSKRWKTQLSGATSFSVNIQLGGSVHRNGHILVSKDGKFVPAETMIYEVDVDGVAKGVAIANGDYIALAGNPSGPAGVGVDLRLWLRADDSASLDLTGSDVNVWKDKSASGNNYSASVVTGTNQAVTLNQNPAKMNFFPTLTFGASSALAVQGNATSNPRPMSVDKPDDYTLIIVRNSSRTDNGYSFVTSFGGTNPALPAQTKPGIGYAPNSGKGYVHDEGSYLGTATIVGSPANQTILHTFHSHKGATTAERFFNHDFAGWNESVKIPAWGNGSAMASGGVIGGGYSTLGRYEGDIAEVIYYEKQLDENESAKVKTYLALKYGLTLDANPTNATINYDYQLLDGTKIWEGNAAPFVAYHNNIAGLMRDDATNVFVNKSQSSNDGSHMTVQLKGHKDNGQGATSLFTTDLSAVVWGHDLKTGITPLPEEVCSPAEFKLNKTWLFSKTQNMPSTDLEIRMVTDNDMFPINNAEMEAYIFIAGTQAEIDNNTWKTAIPGYFKDGAFHFPAHLVADKSFVTFGYRKIVNTTCPPAVFDGVKILKFDDPAHRWAYGSRGINADLGDGFTAEVKLVDDAGTNILYNYPIPYHYSGLLYHRTGLGVITTTMKLSGPAFTSFDIYSLDQYLKSTDNVEIYGTCGAGSTDKIYPTLRYNDTPARSTYTISGDGKASGVKQYMGYGIKQSTLSVEFNVPVDNITIIQNTTGTKALQYSGISTVKFSTPVAPPTPVDGTTFVKSAPTTASACEVIPIEWKIANYNCDVRVVSFSDLVKSGLSWVEGSVSVQGEEAGSTYTIADYTTSQNLNISNIAIPSYGEVTIKAMVAADVDVSGIGQFGSKGVITYASVSGVGNTTLESCDRDKADCQETITVVTGTNGLKPIVSTSSVDANYREDQIVEVNFMIENLNATSLNGALRITHNEEFVLEAGSITSSTGLDLTSANITTESGNIVIENLDFTKIDKPHVITLKLKAPAVAGLIEDPAVTGGILPLKVEHFITSTDTDECTAIAFKDAKGLIYSPYKECVVYNYDIAINTTTGNRAFNEIRTADVLEFKFTKKGTDKPVRAEDVLTIELPKYLEVGDMNITSTDIPAAVGIATPISNELVEVGGVTVRHIKFKLPAEAINNSAQAGLNLSLTYLLDIEYKRVDDVALIATAQYPVKADVVTTSDCETGPVSAGKGNTALAFLTAKRNAYLEATVNDPITLEIINPNFDGKWYEKDASGNYILLTSQPDHTLNITPTVSGDKYVYVDAMFGGDVYGKVPVRIMSVANLDFNIKPNMAAVCEGSNIDLLNYVDGAHAGTNLEFFYDPALKRPITGSAVTVTETTEFYVRSVVAPDVSDSKTITVLVNAKTVIETDLLPTLRVSDAGTISLSVKARGTNLTYQWYKDNVAIAGATSANYQNANSNPDDHDGIYHVVVTGTCGDATSKETTVKVDPSLVFTAISHPTFECPPFSINLETLVSGKKDGVTLVYYTDADATQVLADKNVTVSQTTTYYVRAVFADKKSEVQKMTINITPETTIVTQPKAVNYVGYKGVIALSVEATGSNLTYQWYKNNSPIVGATLSTYTQSSAMPNDNGTYHVEVTGDCKTKKSEEALVQVDPSLEFTVVQPDATCVDETIDLTTLVSGEAAGVTLKYFSDAELKNELIGAARQVTVTGDAVYYVHSFDGRNDSKVQTIEIVSIAKPTSNVLSETINVSNGAAIKLSVTATGSNLKYQWYKGAVLLEGETTNQLIILNAKTTNNGIYNVKIIANCETLDKQVADVTVQPSLDFTVANPAAICPADNVNLAALVTDVEAGITVKYYADRAGVEELASPTVAPTTTTSYYVISSDGLTTGTPQMITVEVKTATAITTNLVSSYRVSDGGNISLSVVAVGENLTYQWFKNDVAIAGATSASYVNQNSTPDNDGVYHVVVTGDCGAVTSVKATVKVDPSLQFTASNNPGSVCPNTPIELKDLVTGVSAGVTVKYYQDANATIELASTAVAPQATTSYYVQATYLDVTSPIQAIRVDVTPSTVIVTAPSSIDVSYQGAIVLQVEATGSNVTYQWSKDGVDLVGETRATYEKSGATPADNGVYTVVVSGDCGNPASLNATVKVDASLSFTVTDSAPICIGETLNLNTLITGIEGEADGVVVKFFTTAATTTELPSATVTAIETITYYAQSVDADGNKGEVQPLVVTVYPNVAVTALVDQKLVEKDAITLEAKATGLNLTYQWYKDGVALAGETRKVLEILNATKADEGTYKVIVTGDCKSVESVATVTVDDGLSIKVTNPAAICVGTTLNLADYVSFINNPTNGGIIKFYSDELATIETSATVTPAVTTTYYVKATDALTETPVLKIVVTVNAQATATMTSGVDIVCANTEADLTLALTGTAPWTVVYTDGTQDYTLSGIADANHTFKVMVAKATTYTLKSVVDALGCINTNVSSPVSIDIHADVAITEQPQSLVFCLGNDVTLIVKADNAVRYQWYKDGVALTGETGNVLDITDAVATDMGLYHVAVIGECETVESNKVQVDGNILDIIVQKWNNTLVANNNPANNGGYKFVSYKWYRDGEFIGEGPYHTVGNDPTATLVMGAAYHLEVTTDDGKVMVTCPYYPVLKDQLYVNVYPNMVSLGDEVNLEIRNGDEPVNNAVMEIYTVSGMHVKTLNVKESIVPLNLPYRSDLYLVKVKFDGYSNTFKVVVK